MANFKKEKRSHEIPNNRHEMKAGGRNEMRPRSDEDEREAMRMPRTTLGGHSIRGDIRARANRQNRKSGHGT